MADDKELLLKIKALDELTPVMLKAIQSMDSSATKLAESIEKINAPTERLTEGAGNLNTTTINLAAGLNLIKMAADAAMMAFNALSGQVGMAIDEAIEAEQALNQLNGALVSQGLYTEKNVASIDKYVSAIEAQTGVSGEAIQKMIAMGVQMGLSVEKAQEMEEASRKLAAATGVDVMTAFSQMQGALTGQTRALAKVIPGVKDLTEAQLKQGGAIALVSQQLDAQYQLYEKSFLVGVDKAKNALSNVYETVGKIITQNPLVIKSITAFTEWVMKLQTAIEKADKWVRDHEQTILRFGKAVGIAITAVTASVVAFKTMSFGIAVFDALATSIKLYGVAGTLAANGINLATFATTALKAAVTFLTGPIGLTITAVTALTAAFYKWPGLFDQISGSFKIFVGYFIQGISWITEKTARLVGIFDKDLAKSLSDISKGIENYSDQWKLAGIQQVEVGEQINKTADIAVEAAQKETTAFNGALAAQSRHNAVLKEKSKLYDEINIGTDKQREAMKAQGQERDADLKDFTEWLEAKKRVALTKAEEESMEVGKIRSDALKGSGPSGNNAAADAELNAEYKKQAELKVLRDQNIISDAEYREALLASNEKYAQIELQQAQAQRQALGDALGTSEEGYQLKEQIEQERFELELAQKMERAEILGATDQQIQSMRDEAEAVHRQNRLDLIDQHNNEVAAREEVSGATVTATRQKYYRDQEKAQSENIKSFASGVSTMQSLQTSMNATFSKLGDALVKNQRITAENMAGVFLENFGRQIQQQGFGNLVLGLFPPNPAALAAGAAQIAAGTAIARQGVGMQKGGQADEGMDSIPASLAGKSFVLSQGERVVQPEANKQLTEFLSKEKNGGGKSGAVYNVTLNYGGNGSPQDARAMAEMVVKEIRLMSERGTPVISDKGVIKS